MDDWPWGRGKLKKEIQNPCIWPPVSQQQIEKTFLSYQETVFWQSLHHAFAS